MVIDIGKVRPSAKHMMKIAESEMRKKVKRVRSGKAIRRRYAPSTEAKRRKYGLRTSSVNLYGNSQYSNKNWRMLDSWRVKRKDNKTVVIEWTFDEAARLYDYHVRIFGNFLKE